VVEGELMVRIGDKESRLGPGDMFCVAPGISHTIRLLGKHARLVDTFTPIRDDFLG
jgi:quercetin dioxygenase-like cupin family protein